MFCRYLAYLLQFLVRAKRKGLALYIFKKKSKDRKYIYGEIIFQSLLNQTQIRMYLPFPVNLEPNGLPFGGTSDGIITIQIRFDLARDGSPFLCKLNNNIS